MASVGFPNARKKNDMSHLFLQHGDLDPKDVKLEVIDGVAKRLHVSYDIVSGKPVPVGEGQELRLHSTDGASHRYTPVEEVHDAPLAIAPIEKKAKK